MLPRNHNELSQKAQQALGIPDGMRIYSSSPFGGMNQSDARMGMEDNEFFLRENFIRIGKNKLRSVWGEGPILYTAPAGKTIVYYDFYNIGLTNYVAVFISDGTAIQINTATSINTTISSAANTFYNGGQLPASTQWGSQYYLIVNNITPNSYWIWDGSLLYFSGTLGPQVTITDPGSNYTSAPTVTAFGGSGSGAMFQATVNDGAVVSVQVTNPGIGYLPTDVVQLAFSGGGSDSSAQLEAVLTMGTLNSIEVIDGGTSYSAPVISFINGGGHASATASLTTMAVSSIAVNTGGVYTSPPTVVISGGGGTGATATAHLTGTAITSFTVTNGGSGYTSAPKVSFYGGGQATATVTQSGGIITQIDLTNNGSGFTSTPSVVITDSAGSGGVAVAVLGAGSVASVTIVNGGSNFSSTPTLSFQGGSGTGAAATATLTGGVITSVAVTNGGTGYTSAPAVLVESGINNAASATPTLMPFGVSGASIESFQQQLWIPYPNQQGNQQNGNTFLVSAPGSLTDFATSDGGLTYTSSSPFLRSRYVNIKQSNGYLYPFGDSSVDVISNVQTSGSPSTTTFNYYNTDPQTGTSWRDSVQEYGRTILFGNQFGVFGLYGGSVTKVSAKMDELFTNGVFPPTAGAVVPSSASADIFSQKVFMMLMTTQDPITLANRNVLISWDEKDWMLLSQESTLTYISTQEINSTLTAWGTDGTNLFPLFNTASATLNKRLSTKLWGIESELLIKEAQMIIVQAQDNSVNNAGIDFSAFTVDNELGSTSMNVPVIIISPKPKNAVYSAGAPNVPGVNLGITLASTSPDFTLNYLGLGYTDISSIYGSQNLNQQTGE